MSGPESLRSTMMNRNFQPIKLCNAASEMTVHDVSHTSADSHVSNAGSRKGRHTFRNTDLQGQSFAGCTLKKADFSGSRLGGADFTACCLTEARFEGAKLEGARFVSADLSDSDFSRAELSGALFTGACLRRARLTDASLVTGRFDGAFCETTDFSRSDITGTTWAGAMFSHTRWDQAYWGPLEVSSSPVTVGGPPFEVVIIGQHAVVNGELHALEHLLTISASEVIRTGRVGWLDVIEKCRLALRAS